jgi:glycosyltransferase involved in cell wall biosynthesis
MIDTGSLEDLYEEKFADCEKIKRRLIEVKTGKNVIRDAPKASIIIPAYNVAEFIAGTLDSVLAQTCKNYEIILVNDGSTDTVEFESAVEPYFDEIIYVKQENLGASQARNSAICLSRGELLAFLDGDDFWFPEFLESQISFLENNNLDMAYSDALLFGEPLYEGKTFSETSPSYGEVTTESLISCDCNVITSGTILKKEWLPKVGLFDTGLNIMQDFDLWFRMAKHGAKIGYQDRVLAKYRVRSNSLTGGNVQRARRNIRALKVIEHKYDLTEREREVWEKQLAVFEAECELEQGKLSLTQGDFFDAREHFIKANSFLQKPKLSLIIWLLRISPKLTLRLFKKLRPAEFSFISPQKS